MVRLKTKDIITSLQDIANLRQEHFICFSLDLTGALIAKRTVFIGTLTTTIVHPREIYADPLVERAAAIIIAHNHPSGIAQPSGDDITTTQLLIAAGLILGIPLRDHIIVARNQHFSFQKHGLITTDTYAMKGQKHEWLANRG